MQGSLPRKAVGGQVLRGLHGSHQDYRAWQKGQIRGDNGSQRLGKEALRVSSVTGTEPSDC